MSIIRKEQLTNPLSASYALTASYAENANTSTTNTGSLLTTASVSLNTITFTKGDTTQFSITVDTGSGGTTDTSGFVTTSSFNAFTSSINQFTSSYNTGSFSGSFTGSLNGTAATASYYQETDPIFVAKSASLATTGSNTFNGDQTISGSLFVYNTSTNNNSLNTLNRTLIAADGIESVSWGSRQLIGNNGFETIKWSEYILVDSSRNTSADWEQRYLYANDGTTVHLDWSDPNNLAFPSIQENPITRVIGTDDNGRVWYTASSAIGGGGSTTNPGGSNTQIQYNNSNTFGGVPTLTYDGTTLKATGSFTGSFVGSLTGTASWATNALTASYFAASNASISDNGSGDITFNTVRTIISASNKIVLQGNNGIDITGTTTINGNLLPGPPYTNNTSSYDLGSPTAAWKDLYVSNGSVYFISGSNTASISFTNGAIDFGSSPVIIPTGSTVLTASYAETASFLLGSVTSASYAATASILLGSVTSASYATTASYLNNGVSFAGSGSIITGSTAISSSYGLLIPANTFTVGDIVKIQGVFLKPNAASSTNFYVYINTSDQLSGATQVAVYNTTTVRWVPITRTLSIESPTRTTAFAASTSHYNDDIVITTGFNISGLNIDWTVDQYLLFAASNQTTSDRTDTLRFYAKKI